MKAKTVCLWALFFLIWLCRSAQAWEGYVLRVEDGNTISVSERRNRDDAAVLLRFYGIEAPTLRQPFGPQARDRLLKLMPRGTKVSVDTVGKDEHGAMSALVQVGGASVNYQLVAEGLAWVSRATCKAIFCRRWLIQEHQAVVDRRGVWSLNMSTPPWQWGR